MQSEVKRRCSASALKLMGEDASVQHKRSEVTREEEKRREEKLGKPLPV